MQVHNVETLGMLFTKKMYMKFVCSNILPFLRMSDSPIDLAGRTFVVSYLGYTVIGPVNVRLLWWMFGKPRHQNIGRQHDWMLELSIVSCERTTKHLKWRLEVPGRLKSSVDGFEVHNRATIIS